MSGFWSELLALSGTRHQFTTAYHPQTNGQSEVTNRALEQYLRSFAADPPTRWFNLLPWAELALNCSTNADIGMSPFQALYVQDILEERESTLRTLKERIGRSQSSMAEFANRHRRDVKFGIGDKKFISSVSATCPLPDTFDHNHPMDTPIRATATHTVLIDRVLQEQWLVHWSTNASSAPTWESVEMLRSHFPHLHLEVKAVVLEGGVDTGLNLQPPEEAERPIDETAMQHVDNKQPGIANQGARSNRPRRKITQPARFKDYTSH
ncbi:hypothetical protein AAHA92_09202 [Salvia divinorum]|uniref:Integrase catalytic domain-containing protein n=1 Tax=Salvia divinorum TaxID=28513 RepID=A0ABD1HRD7_SALDI